MNAEENEISIIALFNYELYRSPEWQVCKYRSRDKDTIFVAVGKSLPTRRNLPVELFGKWTKNRKTGRNQFSVSRYDAAKASSEPELIAYFASLKCGIGSLKAKLIYRHFGADTWDILERTPQRLTEVPGIGQKALQRILSAMEQHKASAKLVQLFAKAGAAVSGSNILDMISTFGESAAEQLADNPFLAYLRADVPFDKAEALADYLGIPTNAPIRLSAMACRILCNAAISGHVCLPKQEVLALLRKESGCTDTECRSAITEAWRVGDLKCSNSFLYTAARLEEEKQICSELMRLLNSGHGPIASVDPLIREYEEKSGFQLAESQKKAIWEVFNSQVSIITGGPGVGKTTVCKAVLSIHALVFGQSSRPLLLAPTGKAARRLAEVTGYPALTIHSAIGWRGDKLPCPDVMLDGNLILVDEVSMMDQHICSLLLSRIPAGCRLVLIGDSDQLPSVGCGNVLYDLIASQVIPLTRLSVIFRQADGNPIIANIHKVNEGRTDITESNSFRFIETEDEEETFQEAVTLYLRCARADGDENVLLLNPQRNNTNLSVDRLNDAIQNALNPSSDPDREMKVGRTVFRVGDRIMQLRNNEFAMNGDIGYIKDIFKRRSPDSSEEFETLAAIEFDHDGLVREYRMEDMRTISHAWCMTVHKAQGSEYKTVIQIISTAHPSMLKRQIVYTGLSRSRENVAIIGQRDAFRLAVENCRQEKRSTQLAERLYAAYQPYADQK